MLHAALALALLAAAFAQEPAWRGVPVLMYHKVDAVTPAGAVGKSLTLEPAQFEGQLAWLKAHHIATLTTDELARALRRGEHPKRSVVLTFDDGYEDAVAVIAPLLTKYGARASFYVSADLIGSPGHASWSELRALANAGNEIGCHGSAHLDLTTLAPSAKEREIGHCAASLARWLGQPPRTYAYASGAYDAATIALVRHFGFVAALTEHPGAVTSIAKPYELPRRRIDRADTLAAFSSAATP